MHLDSIVTEISLLSIMLRFLLNIAVLFVLVRLIYYRYSKKPVYLFSFFLMGIIIFFICSFLETVNIEVGIALGLFAIFSILRFRTINYTVKDMTYVFTVIGVSVINAYANIPPPILGAIATNLVIIAAVYILEKFMEKNGMTSIIIIYNKPKFLNPKSENDLMKDLADYTGHKTEKYKIRKMDIKKGTAEIEVYYKNKGMQ